jgi:hypothetical protein
MFEPKRMSPVITWTVANLCTSGNGGSFSARRHSGESGEFFAPPLQSAWAAYLLPPTRLRGESGAYAARLCEKNEPAESYLS